MNKRPLSTSTRSVVQAMIWICAGSLENVHLIHIPPAATDGEHIDLVYANQVAPIACETEASPT